MYLNLSRYSYRNDKTVPQFKDTGPLCVMDARCSLCARGAAWIARNDKTQAFRIIPMQSDLGGALLIHYSMDPEDPTSWLFLENGQGHASLDALIRVGQRLGGVWRLLSVLHILPGGLRDALYRTVARNRYRWFGTTDLCNLPDPEVQKRLMT
ncbi:DUF393 domain-containing protein [Sedimentitalea sp. CY04]|uniref:DUF393 domain-containing protein n=1 Tax=Parasedimentitalea denitrificans TaxID=2211118 RepID=A0ABX0W206_9RHOB|nr:DCC1-like thiol-disulfide oxidoreductase family protein [Sedimentitalea sp. CY04]NIZ59666.1 DUF393 domain-containing protein [Sedimentitalea sp. CY04]